MKIQIKLQDNTEITYLQANKTKTSDREKYLEVSK